MDWGSMVSGLIGGIHNRSDELSGREEQTRQRELQQESLQHGVQWRVNDAKAAGIHPLFGLGANLPTFNPVTPVQSDTSFAQDIGRAVSSYANRGRQAKADALAMERHNAEIGVLRSEAARNDAVAEATVSSSLARAAQLANQIKPTPNIIYPKGQVDSPQLERFRTPLGVIDANKRHVDAEEAERRYGDLAQEVFGLSNLISDSYETAVNHPMFDRFMKWKFGGGR